MQRPRLVLAAAVLVVAPTCGVGAVANAEAATHGSVTWNFSSSRINAGAPVQVTYHATGVAQQSIVSIQQQFGTKHVWKNVANFPVGRVSTTVNLPAVPIGDYVYRLRVSTGHRLDFYSLARRLYAYGNITLTTICHAFNNGGCGPGSVQLQNSQIYNYELTLLTFSTVSPGDTAMSAKNNSCRSGTLTIESGIQSARNPGDITSVQITQSASNPQLTTLPDTSQTVFNFNLDGGPFDLDAWHSGGPSTETVVWFSGTFNCYTLNGLR
jgi:hypothetical protein